MAHGRRFTVGCLACWGAMPNCRSSEPSLEAKVKPKMDFLDGCQVGAFMRLRLESGEGIRYQDRCRFRICHAEYRTD